MVLVIKPDFFLMIHVFKSVEKDSIIPHQRRFLTKRFHCGLCSQQALEFMSGWQMGEARCVKKRDVGCRTQSCLVNILHPRREERCSAMALPGRAASS